MSCLFACSHPTRRRMCKIINCTRTLGAQRRAPPTPELWCGCPQLWAHVLSVTSGAVFSQSSYYAKLASQAQAQDDDTWEKSWKYFINQGTTTDKFNIYLWLWTVFLNCDWEGSRKWTLVVLICEDSQILMGYCLLESDRLLLSELLGKLTQQW